MCVRKKKDKTKELETMINDNKKREKIIIIKKSGNNNDDISIINHNEQKYITK